MELNAEYNKWYKIGEAIVPVNEQILFAKDDGMFYCDGIFDGVYVEYYGDEGKVREELDEFTHFFAFEPLNIE